MLFKLPETHQHVYATLISKNSKKLDISNLDLNQPIPKAFLNPTLTALEGFNAGVVGQLPPELWMMESLQLLSLGANCDSYGVIPTTVANLSDLRVLDLSYCNLMESCIPSEICNLRNICQLSLHDCNLAGAIPDSFNLLTV
ncbi:hypothetical protein BDR26DRAFT_863212 [Obelidium mucronatum]|nr:hypothetical protein BDR26DRAFT_863212 [Obelidium mucronatum]